MIWRGDGEGGEEEEEEDEKRDTAGVKEEESEDTMDPHKTIHNNTRECGSVKECEGAVQECEIGRKETFVLRRKCRCYCRCLLPCHARLAAWAAVASQTER